MLDTRNTSAIKHGFFACNTGRNRAWEKGNRAATNRWENGFKKPDRFGREKGPQDAPRRGPFTQHLGPQGRDAGKRFQGETGRRLVSPGKFAFAHRRGASTAIGGAEGVTCSLAAAGKGGRLIILDDEGDFGTRTG